MSQKDITIVPHRGQRRKPLPHGVEKVKQQCQVTTGNPQAQQRAIAAIKKPEQHLQARQIPIVPSSLPQPGSIWENRADNNKVTIAHATGILPTDLVVFGSTDSIQKGEATDAWILTLAAFVQKHKAL